MDEGKKENVDEEEKHNEKGLQTNNTSRECSLVYKIRMKSLAIHALHKIQRYKEATLSEQKHQGPNHAFIHQHVHTNPTNLGEGQGKHKTL